MVLPPVPYPATIEVIRPVDDRATVAFRRNRYSVNPGMGGTQLTLRHRLGTTTLEVLTPAGALLVAHRLAPAGAGAIVRTPSHRAALEAAVLSQFSSDGPVTARRNGRQAPPRWPNGLGSSPRRRRHPHRPRCRAGVEVVEVPTRTRVLDRGSRRGAARGAAPQQPQEAMPTIGRSRGMPPVEPKNPASPKAKMPPSEATSR